jgi:cell division protein FtsW (lipid II flippase)
MFVAGMPMLLLTGLMLGLSIPVALIMIQGHDVPSPLNCILPATLDSNGLVSESESCLETPSRPQGQSDFIFSVSAEGKDFLGSVIVTTLYSLIFIHGSKIARLTRDRLGELWAMGVIMMLFSPVFINIGMNLRLMPVTGTPLPLLSYSGCSVVCSLIAIGILQKYLNRRSYEYE